MTAAALEFRDLNKVFKGTWSNRNSLHAVKDVSLRLEKGEIAALVGQSGSGKTTLGRMAALLEHISSGSLLIDGVDFSGIRGKKLRDARRNVQIVFQDPFDSVDARQTIFQTVEECLLQTGTSRGVRRSRTLESLAAVGLDTSDSWLGRYPHQLSGGQRQRLAIARAIVLEPAVVIADEPVSMLDVSVRAGILRLFEQIRRDRNTACLFITHDLAVARYVSDTIHVMYRGEIVESGLTEEIIARPQHDYTKLLLSSAPELELVPADSPQHTPQIQN